jgi:hypothetical protein
LRRPLNHEPNGRDRVLYPMIRLRSAVATLALFALPAAAALAQARGRTIDEGTFIVTRAGSPIRAEAFKITRADDDLIQATAQVSTGEDRISSSLIADSVGTPVQYMFLIKNHGAMTLDVRAMARGRRLSVRSADSRSNESMKDLPITPGQCVVLDADLLHQLYFVPLGHRSGELQIIDPRDARAESAMLTGRGLEPVEIGGRSVTATHYSLSSASARRDFWVDAAGRLLKVELPALGVVAMREELPR